VAAELMTTFNGNLAQLARRVLELAQQRNATLITAESCTAGKLSALLSEAEGAGECLHGSFVTYTKDNKTKSLGVSAELLKAKGAVCREVALAMAEGAFRPSLGQEIEPVRRDRMQHRIAR
jgi:nicotinamide-nucleotide amidase